jgi:hypothetical protein
MGEVKGKRSPRGKSRIGGREVKERRIRGGVGWGASEEGRERERERE